MANFTGSFDYSKATKAECQAEANRRLDQALRFEAEGKSEKFISLAMTRGIEAEYNALDGRK